MVPLAAIWVPVCTSNWPMFSWPNSPQFPPAIKRDRRVARGKLGSPAPRGRWVRGDIGGYRGMFSNWAHQRREDAGSTGVSDTRASHLRPPHGIPATHRSPNPPIGFPLPTSPLCGPTCRPCHLAVQSGERLESIVRSADRFRSDRLSALTLNINSTHCLRGEELFIVKIALLLVLVTDNSFTFLRCRIDDR